MNFPFCSRLFHGKFQKKYFVCFSFLLFYCLNSRCLCVCLNVSKYVFTFYLLLYFYVRISHFSRERKTDSTRCNNFNWIINFMYESIRQICRRQCTFGIYYLFSILFTHLNDIRTPFRQWKAISTYTFMEGAHGSIESWEEEKTANLRKNWMVGLFLFVWLSI